VVVPLDEGRNDAVKGPSAIELIEDRSVRTWSVRTCPIAVSSEAKTTDE
jgi:hypothetical protein